MSRNGHWLYRSAAFQPPKAGLDDLLICMLSAPRTAAHPQPGKALSPGQYPYAVSAAQSTYLRM